MRRAIATDAGDYACLLAAILRHTNEKSSSKIDHLPIFAVNGMSDERRTSCKELLDRVSQNWKKEPPASALENVQLYLDTVDAEFGSTFVGHRASICLDACERSSNKKVEAKETYKLMS